MNPRIWFVLRFGELRPLVDAETDIRVWCAPTNLAGPDTARGMDCDLQHTDSGVDGSTG